MAIEGFSFGSILIDGVNYKHDVVIDHGVVHKRRKKASKQFRDQFGHTPLTLAENIPWDCKCLVVGTGAEGALPVTEEVRNEAERRGVELVMLLTPQAIELLKKRPRDTSAVLHVTC
ncbi:MAG: MTH938/NDUFAF3 family protein [Spirochaetia bacterium]|jgi:hypothetical protein